MNRGRLGFFFARPAGFDTFFGPHSNRLISRRYAGRSRLRRVATLPAPQRWPIALSPSQCLGPIPTPTDIPRENHMIFLTRSAVLICASIGAGMATQEAVNRLAMDDEQSKGPALGALGVWSTAEGYYRASDVPEFLLAAAPQVPEGPKPASAYDTGATKTPAKDHDVGADHADAQLHPRELVQEDPRPSAVIGAPSVAVPEPDPSVVHTLPAPTKPIPIGDERNVDGSPDRPGRPGYVRTPVKVAPPTTRRAVPPVRPVLPVYDRIGYPDPAEAVQRRAQLRAEERRRRIEAWKWLGYSPLRPPVGATPFMEGDSRRPAVIIIPYVVYDRD